jgi:hypothetical protein
MHLDWPETLSNVLFAEEDVDFMLSELERLGADL